MFVRKYVRLVLVVLWCIFMFSIRFAAKIVRPFSKPLDVHIRRGLFRFAMRIVLAITGMRVEVRGTPPPAPFFLVCTHLSFLDVFLIASQLGCVFVSREDLEHWPIFGFISKGMNTIFINRSKLKDTVRVNALISQAMSDGYGVTIFPESKVSQNSGVLPFKPALLESAARMKLPVHYATIHYATPDGTPPASEVAVWRDGVSFIRHYLNVAALPYYNAILTFGEAPIEGEDRKELAEKLCEACRKQFIPLD